MDADITPIKVPKGPIQGPNNIPDELCITAPIEEPPPTEEPVRTKPAKPLPEKPQPEKPWTEPFEPPTKPLKTPEPCPGTHPVCFYKKQGSQGVNNE
jgi:hypothetical protein